MICQHSTWLARTSRDASRTSGVERVQPDGDGGFHIKTGTSACEHIGLDTGEPTIVKAVTGAVIMEQTIPTNCADRRSPIAA